MKSLLEGIQISDDMSKKELEELFNNLCELVEFEFWISIEEGFEKNSYWIATPDEEISEDDFVGIIEIDIELDPLTKICALTHEVGHFLLDQDIDFRYDMHLMFKESLAWYLGYKFFKERGIVIDLDKYKKDASWCLEQYVRSLNEQDSK